MSTAIAIVGVWFAPVGALYVTAPSPNQALMGILGFLFALLATVFILMGSSDEKAPVKTSDPKESGSTKEEAHGN